MQYGHFIFYVVNFLTYSTEPNQILYGRILKANLSWSPTWAKFCQLVANLSWFYLNLIWKISNLSTWCLALSAKMKNTNTVENFCITRVRLFSI